MRFFRDNGLTIVLLAATLVTIVGMLLSGWQSSNQELAEHGFPQLTLLEYAGSGDFISAMFENWESEFLQMSTYVVLTAFLFQRGSAESKDPDDASPQEEDFSAKAYDRHVPGPLRAGPLAQKLYAYSLGIVLILLFVASFILHLFGSAQAENAEAALHGHPAVSLLNHLGSARFWFESFQNWQSEFFSTAVLVVLSIFLRFKGSPESKPVAAPHHQTGG
jgi:hypothetical protein